MKLISARGLTVLASDIGAPDLLSASPVESSAVLMRLAEQNAWGLATTDNVALSSTPVDFSHLWNWPAATAFGDIRPEPLVGLVLSFSVSNLQLVVGAQIEINYSFAYQPAGGYGSGPPGVINHKILARFDQNSSRSYLLGILPAILTQGRAALALPYIQKPGVSPAAPNLISVNGIPAATQGLLRVLNKYDPDMLALWPTVAENLYGGRT